MNTKGHYLRYRTTEQSPYIKVFYTIHYGFNCVNMTIFAKNKISEQFSLFINSRVKLNIDRRKYDTIIKLQIDTTQFKYEYELHQFIDSIFKYS